MVKGWQTWIIEEMIWQTYASHSSQIMYNFFQYFSLLSINPYDLKMKHYAMIPKVQENNVQK